MIIVLTVLYILYTFPPDVNSNLFLIARKPIRKNSQFLTLLTPHGGYKKPLFPLFSRREAGAARKLTSLGECLPLNMDFPGCKIS